MWSTLVNAREFSIRKISSGENLNAKNACIIHNEIFSVLQIYVYIHIFHFRRRRIFTIGVFLYVIIIRCAFLFRSGGVLWFIAAFLNYGPPRETTLWGFSDYQRTERKAPSFFKSSNWDIFWIYSRTNVSLYLSDKAFKCVDLDIDILIQKIKYRFQQ